MTFSDLLSRARAQVARRGAAPPHDPAQHGVHDADRWAALPARLPARVWLGVVVAFLAVYLFMFTHVHVIADTRICQLRLDDPLMALVPRDPRWLFITVDVYTVLTIAGIVALFTQAFLGDHRPIIRWGLGLTICGMFRAATILLVPLCRHTRQPGTAALEAIPTLDLGFTEVPWRMFASNDLLFSGHVCELCCSSARRAAGHHGLAEPFGLIRSCRSSD